MLELHGKVDEKTPYVLVALQECERMNTLTDEIRRSLKELDLGLKVCCHIGTLAIGMCITPSVHVYITPEDNCAVLFFSESSANII